MSKKGGNWKAVTDDPYIDWWKTIEKKLKPEEDEFQIFEILSGSKMLSNRKELFKQSNLPHFIDDTDLTRVFWANQRKNLNGWVSRSTDISKLPLPKYAIRPKPAANSGVVESDMPPPNADDLIGPDENGNGGLDDDTIVVVVIDNDIPLGHRRFRNADGTSRILASWQMVAPWKQPKDPSRLGVPFGRELYKKHIDELLDEYSIDGLNGWLDEQAFNAETGVLDMSNHSGRRTIAGHNSHGAHVLDIAAGVDPFEDPEFARRAKIIAINIPTSSTFGAPGTFLDDYLIQGIMRATDIADALWAKHHPSHEGKSKGYPLVFNMSFGKQAGARSLNDRLPGFVAEYKNTRAKTTEAKSYFVMPSGNDNLLRCNAFLEFDKKGEEKSLNWRVLPEDRSSNFAEIWVELKENETRTPISIALISPDQNSETLQLHTDKEGKLSTLKENVAIYYDLFSHELPDSKPAIRQMRYLICLAPTHIAETDEIPPVSSGVWSIKVRNERAGKVQCRLSIQTDQGMSVSGSQNLRSYFDDERYRMYDDRGRFVESSIFLGSANEHPDLQGGSPVKRHGTMNSSASTAQVARVGGYRQSDGKPSRYSATGRGRSSGEDAGTSEYKIENREAGAPTAALPCDDGPAHFGFLAAGSADGSVAAMRGTSFASSQATRCVVDHLMASGSQQLSVSEILFQLAENTELARSKGKLRRQYPELADIEQAGRGRIERPKTSRIDRTGYQSS
jgi:hypothetical protein